MLCLTRKVGERILLPGTGITFTVLAVKPGGAVRIGIEAPQWIRIVREEVELRAVQDEARRILDSQQGTGV
jgi:carbon storage regulator CsrA